MALQARQQISLGSTIKAVRSLPMDTKGRKHFEKAGRRLPAAQCCFAILMSGWPLPLLHAKMRTSGKT